MRDLVVIKLGGALITSKSENMKADLNRIKALVNELASLNRPLVVVHGGGSFGHSVALEYNVAAGKSLSTVHAAWLTMRAMSSLNSIVTDEMSAAGFSPISLPPHALFESRRFPEALVKVCRSALANGFVPVTYGDVVLDRSVGFRIVSGDYLASQLAVRLSSTTLIYATAVSGVYSTYPPGGSDSLIRVLNRKTRFSAENTDATGGIAYKVSQALVAARAGVRTLILSGTKRGNILGAARGEDIDCTRVVW